MAKVRSHLSRAPINEALLDFHVQQQVGLELAAVQKLAESIDGYRVKGPIYQLQAVLAVTNDGPKNSTNSQEIGVRLHSGDDKYVLQLRINGLTISRLEPYGTWGELVAETRNIWALYKAQLAPTAIIRIATRYINHLKLPMKLGENFEEYLTKPPEIPSELPQGLLGFMQRLVLPHPDLGVTANVIQLLQEGLAPPDHVPVVLDIDVYKQVQLKTDTEDMWNFFEDLRSFKNEIFFASLTDKTIELYE